jgi:hypothetical protein
VWEVGDDQGVGDAPVLVHYDQIGDVRGQAGGDEVANDCVATVEAVGIREDEAEFLKSGLVR